MAELTYRYIVLLNSGFVDPQMLEAFVDCFPSQYACPRASIWLCGDHDVAQNWEASVDSFHARVEEVPAEMTVATESK